MRGIKSVEKMAPASVYSYAIDTYHGSCAQEVTGTESARIMKPVQLPKQVELSDFANCAEKDSEFGQFLLDRLALFSTNFCFSVIPVFNAFGTLPCEFVVPHATRPGGKPHVKRFTDYHVLTWDKRYVTVRFWSVNGMPSWIIPSGPLLLIGVRARMDKDFSVAGHPYYRLHATSVTTISTSEVVTQCVRSVVATDLLTTIDTARMCRLLQRNDNVLFLQLTSTTCSSSRPSLTPIEGRSRHCRALA